MFALHSKDSNTDLSQQDIDRFCAYVLAERGLSLNTATSYRRDLKKLSAYLSAQGYTLRTANPVSYTHLLTQRRRQAKSWIE